MNKPLTPLERALFAQAVAELADERAAAQVGAAVRSLFGSSE